MVEQNVYLDGLFSSLADPIRRDILRRLMDASYSIRQIADDYDISFAAVAKHINVLERARLVSKERRGKEQIVRVAPSGLADASKYLSQYEALWNRRLDALEQVIQGGWSDEQS
jgi:DNA-binding transcriptional ArsR family regulator